MQQQHTCLGAQVMSWQKKHLMPVYDINCGVGMYLAIHLIVHIPIILRLKPFNHLVTVSQNSMMGEGVPNCLLFETPQVYFCIHSYDQMSTRTQLGVSKADNLIWPKHKIAASGDVWNKIYPFFENTTGVLNLEPFGSKCPYTAGRCQ